MTEDRIRTFSVKDDDDRELVARVKKQASRTGTNFSFIVLEALRQWEIANGERRTEA